MNQLKHRGGILCAIGVAYAFFAIGLKFEVISDKLSFLHNFLVALLMTSGILHLLFLNFTKYTTPVKMWLALTGFFELFIAICLALFSDFTGLSLTHYLGVWAIMRSCSSIYVTNALRSRTFKYWKITLVFCIKALIFSFLFAFAPSFKQLPSFNYLAWVLITLAVWYFRLFIHTENIPSNK